MNYIIHSWIIRTPQKPLKQENYKTRKFYPNIINTESSTVSQVQIDILFLSNYWQPFVLIKCYRLTLSFLTCHLYDSDFLRILINFCKPFFTKILSNYLNPILAVAPSIPNKDWMSFKIQACILTHKVLLLDQKQKFCLMKSIIIFVTICQP